MDESGAHHLACVAANALMALDAILNKTINDDRNKAYNKLLCVKYDLLSNKKPGTV
jgi:hypothetical protein